MRLKILKSKEKGTLKTFLRLNNNRHLAASFGVYVTTRYLCFSQSTPQTTVETVELKYASWDASCNAANSVHLTGCPLDLHKSSAQKELVESLRSVCVAAGLKSVST